MDLHRAVLAITIILTLNIVVRFVPIMSMHWFDEILELLYGALIFYGAAAVWVTHSHFSVGDWISKHLKSVRARFGYRLVVECFSLVFIAVFFWYSWELLLKTDEQTTAFAMSRSGFTRACRLPGDDGALQSQEHVYRTGQDHQSRCGD